MVTFYGRAVTFNLLLSIYYQKWKAHIVIEILKKKTIFTNIIFKLKITDWRLIVQGDE